MSINLLKGVNKINNNNKLFLIWLSKKHPPTLKIPINQYSTWILHIEGLKSPWNSKMQLHSNKRTLWPILYYSLLKYRKKQYKIHLRMGCADKAYYLLTHFNQSPLLGIYVYSHSQREDQSLERSVIPKVICRWGDWTRTLGSGWETGMQ